MRSLRLIDRRSRGAWRAIAVIGGLCVAVWVAWNVAVFEAGGLRAFAGDTRETGGVPSGGPRGENWPRFRGANGLGVSLDKSIPVRWTESDYRWKTEIPG